MAHLTECPYCEMELPDPQDVEAPRSYPQLKRFHAMCRAACFHWPERHPIQFADQEECRRWLLVRVGHGTLQGSVPVVGMTPDSARMLARMILSKAKSKAVTTVRGGEVIVVIPKSIAFAADDAGHKAFCEISDKVQREIETNCEALIENLLANTPPTKRRMSKEKAKAGEKHDSRAN